MMKFTHRFAALCFALALPAAGFAQTMDHTTHMNGQMTQDSQTPGMGQTPTEPGQSAFAAIAEIVVILRNDPDTDWTSVNIDGLRAHLVDMDSVTLKADVATSDVEGGAVFQVTSNDPAVMGSIRRMLVAHGQTMTGVDGIDMQAEEIDGGARMVVTGPDSDLIRGLGFFGVLTLGMHHQAHHIALARGANPHSN